MSKDWKRNLFGTDFEEDKRISSQMRDELKRLEHEYFNIFDTNRKERLKQRIQDIYKKETKQHWTLSYHCSLQGDHWRYKGIKVLTAFFFLVVCLFVAQKEAAETKSETVLPSNRFRCVVAVRDPLKVVLSTLPDVFGRVAPTTQFCRK